MRSRLRSRQWLSSLGCVCLAALMLGGCDPYWNFPRGGWDAMGTINGKEVIAPPDGRAVLDLTDFWVYPETQARKIHSWRIRGKVESGVFHPDLPLKVEGRGPSVPNPRPVNWVPGWVEFAPLQRHLDMEAVSPRQPNLHGVFDPEGRFYPDAVGL